MNLVRGGQGGRLERIDKGEKNIDGGIDGWRGLEGEGAFRKGDREGRDECRETTIEEDYIYII